MAMQTKWNEIFQTFSVFRFFYVLQRLDKFRRGRMGIYVGNVVLFADFPIFLLNKPMTAKRAKTVCLIQKTSQFNICAFFTGCLRHNIYLT